MKKFFLLLLTVSAICTAQKPVDLSYYLPENVTYDPNIPTPESVIGHQVGQWHVYHSKLAQYMKALAAASDRITIEDRGKTFEDRPLLLLTITSPKNHQNIDQLRQDHLDFASGNSSKNANDLPIVVYQGFSIHGNEPSGANAGLLAAYHLAAAQGPEIDALLNDVIVLFDPSYNPDGLSRFAYWANTNKSIHLNTDGNDREFSEVWPGGRTNHYWFDMNRDWLPVQLPESRARIASFHKWMPNILTDHHEMGTNSTFFFQPGVPSRTNPLTPKMNQQLTKEISQFHIYALDKIGSLYYAEEGFDDFYYGKGSTFPDVNGGIGILFEQGSSRGHAQESENGVVTFPFSIRNQFTAALSTLAAAKSMRTKILNYQRSFYSDAKKEAASDRNKAIVFGDEKDAAKAYHLAEILKRHQIKVHELKSDFSQKGKKYKKGYSYIIPMQQQNYKLVKAMFNRQTNFQDSIFYDISAWTFPLAFNLDHANLTNLNQAGAEITDLKAPSPSINKSNYAYLFEWHEYYTPKALHKILKKGLRAKVGATPFKLNGVNYDYGTIMVPVQNQKLKSDALFDFLKEVASESHLKITGVNTGNTVGIDLGSNDFDALTLPKVAMLVGDGVASYDAGEIWHLFDTRYEMNVTKIDSRNFGNTNLSKYTHFILPNTWGGLREQDSKKLKTWVQGGGTLIGFRNAVSWLKQKEFIKLEFKKNDMDAENIKFEQRRNFRGAQVTGGAIFEANIDRSHPINFGYKNDKVSLFRNTNIHIKPDKNSYNNPIKYSSKPLLAGYISEENLDSLKNTVPFQTKRLGRGRVTVFTDNTNFRAFWYGTNKLMMNAIFFSKMM
ncbi:M14 family zinc carboxypeptidase [Spongiivirga citrea]|uniref:Zinc carboxypeptidase n=1 Tax=Spongiivirga citrea TaxID=1481457 RepID=A0A6M0CJE5_9FLAO|nr:M14 family zinc carboxypeptidase [Spongiivirga citrea]NER16059.1 zinc carboxypeptidase [Spongiivirga citrea]